MGLRQREWKGGIRTITEQASPWERELDYRELENGDIQVQIIMRPNQWSLFTELLWQKSYPKDSKWEEKLYELGSLIREKDYFLRRFFTCLAVLMMKN